MSSKKRKNPASSSAAGPPNPSTPPAPSTPTAAAARPQQWRCDVCLTALFDDYDEAVVHEKACAIIAKKKREEEEERRHNGKSVRKKKKRGEDDERGSDAAKKDGDGGDNNGAASATGSENANMSDASPNRRVATRSATRSSTRAAALAEEWKAKGLPAMGEAAASPASSAVSTPTALARLGGGRKMTTRGSKKSASATKKAEATKEASKSNISNAKQSGANQQQQKYSQTQSQSQSTPLTNADTKGFPNSSTNWQCCVCDAATFRNYQQAVEHEKQCLAMKRKKEEVAGEKLDTVFEAEKEGGDGVPDTITVPSKKITGKKAVEAKKAKLNTDKDSADKEVEDNSSQSSSNKRKTNWRCDVCLVAVFEEYDEAVAHEQQCTGGKQSKQKKSKAQGGDVAQEKVREAIKVGSLVMVQDRNKPKGGVRYGGKAHVRHITLSKSANGGECYKYDVSYTEGGYEKGIEARYVTLQPVNQEKWTCDVCNVATFESYEEAVAHEKSCQVGQSLTPPKVTLQKQPPEPQAQLVVKPTAERSPQKEQVIEVEEQPKKAQQLVHNDSFERSPTSAFTTLPRHVPPVLKQTAAVVPAMNKDETKADAVNDSVQLAQSATAEKKESGEKETKQQSSQPAKSAQPALKQPPELKDSNVSKMAEEKQGKKKSEQRPKQPAHDSKWRPVEEANALAPDEVTPPPAETASNTTGFEKLPIDMTIGEKIEAFYKVKDMLDKTEEPKSTVFKAANIDSKTYNKWSKSVPDWERAVATDPDIGKRKRLTKNLLAKLNPTDDNISKEASEEGVMDASKEDSNEVSTTQKVTEAEVSSNDSRVDGLLIESARKKMSLDGHEGKSDEGEKQHIERPGRPTIELEQLWAQHNPATTPGASPSSLPTSHGASSGEPKNGAMAHATKDDSENVQTSLKEEETESGVAKSPDINKGDKKEDQSQQQPSPFTLRQLQQPPVKTEEAPITSSSDKPLEMTETIAATCGEETSSSVEVATTSDTDGNKDGGGGAPGANVETRERSAAGNSGKESTDDKMSKHDVEVKPDQSLNADEPSIQKVEAPTKSRLPKRALVLITIPIALVASIPLHLPERILAMLLLPTVTSITLAVLLLVIIAYSTFAFALLVTHEGPHHHQSKGWFSELFTAVQDSFRDPTTPAYTLEEEEGSTPTLRDFLSDPDGFHMAFAPAFFGFFAYFGALAAMEEETNGRIVPTPLPLPGIQPKTEEQDGNDGTTCCGLKSVAGASAGAMAAVLLASGIQPRKAAEFASTFTWGMVADPPGLGGYVKGNNFEKSMRKFILDAATIRRDAQEEAASSDDERHGFQLEEALVPVAVSGFDLLCMSGRNLSKGCMARAARSSAGFPGLFQPVAWRDHHGNECDSNKKKSVLPDSLLIDGGITDGLGLNGLSTFSGDQKKRVINMVVGDFGFQGPSGIKDMPPGINAKSLVSIAIMGTPTCGPWAMENGPRAVEAARKAMAYALDVPMERGTCKNHYVLRVDASMWLE